MDATHSTVPWRRGWVAGLAVASLILPMVAAFSGDRAAQIGDAAFQADHRLTVAALILGIAAAASTLVFNRWLTPAWLRWLSVGLATLGVMIAAYLLVALIGTCGFAVLGGACAP